MKRFTETQLTKLPKVRLRFGPGETDYFECRYVPAWKAVDLPWTLKDFKPNGVGLPPACGAGYAGMRKKDIFPHPVYYTHAIDSAYYVVCQLDRDDKPALAVRYSHKGGQIISVYDKSAEKPEVYRPLLAAMLAEYPVLKLKKGKLDPRPAGVGHGTGGAQGPTKIRGLVGYARRMERAKFIDQATVDRVAKRVRAAA